jgi:hypothetical protein
MWKTLLILIMTILLCGCSTEKEVVYTTIYPSLPQLQEPNVLSLKTCKWTYPANNDEIFIGMDETNFKCYLKNKEIIREQLNLYSKFIEEINKERLEWNRLNNID